MKPAKQYTRALPAIFHDWEDYPSGVRRESVAILQENGSAVSISKNSSPNGSVEFVVNVKTGDSSTPTLSTAEYASANFGRARCGPDKFNSFRNEMKTCLDANGSATTFDHGVEPAICAL